MAPLLNEINLPAIPPPPEPAVVELSADDLPDALWADYHHDNMTPVVAIDTALIDAWGDIPELYNLWYGESFDDV